MSDHPLQPLLHDLVSVVRAPASVLSEPTGQVRRHGVQGVLHADLRVLCQVELRLDGREPEPLTWAPDGPYGARFVALARWLGNPGPDPTVRVDRLRRLVPRGLVEEIHIVSTASAPVATTVELDLGCDLAPIDLVKSGGEAIGLPAKSGSPGQLIWSAEGVTVTVTGQEGRVEHVGPDLAPGDAVDPGRVDGIPGVAGARLVWPVSLPPGGRTVLRWQMAVDDPAAVVVAPARDAGHADPHVRCDDPRLARLLDRSLNDIRALRLADAEAPDDVFLAAGVPWFLTLFGRDSLWAARMMLPLDTGLAAGTLRVLARRQGGRVDIASGEAPGKIMHELRRGQFAIPVHGWQLPPVYYGTVDATPLWVILLHEAWRWGMPADEVAALLPNLEAALGWLTGHADPDGDGFVEYVDTTGRGLANQGWKDSFDAVRFADGTLARPPIALVEVQGYAYQAAVSGAELLDAFDRPGADQLRDYADNLARRFRQRFWVDGPLGPAPALALDRDKRPVDALTSNIGHLLGTGILSADEATRVAELIADPVLAGSFGLRTMSAKDRGFSPLSYHCGSVWTHDTAIVLTGLAANGFDSQASLLVEGLLSAAESFDYRLPELFGGEDREVLGRPVPYPAACRPQAWSATAAVAILQAAVGLYPDVPRQRVRLRPMAGRLGAISAERLRVAGVPVDVRVDRSAAATLSGLPAGFTVSTGPAVKVPAQRQPTPPLTTSAPPAGSEPGSGPL